MAVALTGDTTTPKAVRPWHPSQTQTTIVLRGQFTKKPAALTAEAVRAAGLCRET
ncbi:MAG: hypothetical protein JWP89_784 [Schlesneria sp.]|nr:hypothetical protein [Schlesneria sp.]